MTNREYLQMSYQSNRDKWLNADSETDDDDEDRFSAQYIIQIRHTNPIVGAVSNVDVGDAYTNRTATNFGQNTNITITSTISGVTYLEFLSQSESQPFIVGRTMIISTTAGQIEQTVAVTHRNASGDRLDHIITPTIDPYQIQTDRVVDDYEYMFDGMSRLRFNQIASNATVTIRMYLISKWSSTQEIAGRNAKIRYAKPNILKLT